MKEEEERIKNSVLKHRGEDRGRRRWRRWIRRGGGREELHREARKKGEEKIKLSRHRERKWGVDVRGRRQTK